MNRRTLIQGGGAAAAALLLSGHTPYGQWVVYRKKHLLIGCHKGDPRTYDLAKQVVALLGEHLPAAKARPARAPRPQRLASLMSTDQLDVAVLGWNDASLMAAGEGIFKPYGKIPLTLLASLGDRALIAHGDFPTRHAWLVAAALGATPLVARVKAPGQTPLPWHPGAAAFRQGEPEPPA